MKTWLVLDMCRVYRAFLRFHIWDGRRNVLVHMSMCLCKQPIKEDMEYGRVLHAQSYCYGATLKAGHDSVVCVI